MVSNSQNDSAKGSYALGHRVLSWSLLRRYLPVGHSFNILTRIFDLRLGSIPIPTMFSDVSETMQQQKKTSNVSSIIFNFYSTHRRNWKRNSKNPVSSLPSTFRNTRPKHTLNGELLRKQSTSNHFMYVYL